MIVLDTNIVSELTNDRATQIFREWAASIAREELFICAPVIAEIVFGAELFHLRTGSSKYLVRLTDVMKDQFSGRILSFGKSAAIIAGKMRAARESMGRPVSAMDMAIAGIAAANNATLATRNVRDFEGLDLKLINPFEA